MSFPSPINSAGSSIRRSDSPEIFLSACLETGIPLPAKLMDLARMDLIFITDRPLRFGTVVQLSIYSDFISAVTQNRAVVHWCRPHPLGWQIGAFLGQPLPDRLTENQWNDLRGPLRYECNWKAWVLWDEGGELEAVKILDYSIGGLRITASRHVAINQCLSLFGSSGGRDRAFLNGQVQWCRDVEQTYQAGIMVFGQTPTGIQPESAPAFLELSDLESVPHRLGQSLPDDNHGDTSRRYEESSVPARYGCPTDCRSQDHSHSPP